jgi:hypothetical protein
MLIFDLNTKLDINIVQNKVQDSIDEYNSTISLFYHIIRFNR